jgi:UDP-N-acetylglucosamine diphosphorylase / glucose-1-phosphate thymidylyltransferase / UDP-N-acetylgalactosamine diphosphorylase / glucosamine-1-phosphate N-acetyltransferase / galactosamine-1-phosphate N-acetyltransferase
MKAIILAAGRGKRMRHLTKNRPKPLLKIGKKTLLDNILHVLPKSVDEIIMVIGYRGNQIKRRYGDDYNGRKIKYVIQKKLNGTAGAVLLTKRFFKKRGERFFIIYGDGRPTKKEIAKCLPHEFSWLCRRVSDPRSSGIARLSKKRRILEVVEKPDRPISNLAAGGVMIVSTDIFRYKPRKHRSGEYYLTSMMNKFIKSYTVKAVFGGKNVSLSTPEDLARANKKM